MGEPTRWTPQELLREIAAAFRLRQDQIVSKQATSRYPTMARMLLAYAMRELTPLSWREIGAWLKRAHSVGLRAAATGERLYRAHPGLMPPRVARALEEKAIRAEGTWLDDPILPWDDPGDARDEPAASRDAWTPPRDPPAST